MTAAMYFFIALIVFLITCVAGIFVARRLFDPPTDNVEVAANAVILTCVSAIISLIWPIGVPIAVMVFVMYAILSKVQEKRC